MIDLRRRLERLGPVGADFSKLLVGNMTVQVVGMLRGILIPLVVTPTQYGLWRLVILAYQYGNFLHLGSLSHLNRELPGLVAQGRHDDVFQERGIALIGTLTTTIVALVIALGVGLAYLETLGEGPWLLLYVFTAAGLLAQQAYLYAVTDARSHSRFGTVSLIIAVRAIGQLVLMVSLGYAFGVPGLAVGMAVSLVIAVLGFADLRAFRPGRFSIRSFGRQSKSGIPLSAVPFLDTTMGTGGQLVATWFLGLQATGFYGMGLAIGAVVYAIPRALGMVLYPRYLANQTQDRQSGAMIRKSLTISSIASSLAACAALILLEPLFLYVVPKYLPALGPTRTLVAMMPFVANATVVQNALLAFRKHFALIAVQVTCTVLATLFALAGYGFTGNVTGIAAGVAVAHVIFGISSHTMALRATAEPGSPVMRDLWPPLAYILAAEACVGALVFGPWARDWDPLWGSLLRLLGLVPVGCVGVWWLWRELRRDPPPAGPSRA